MISPNDVNLIIFDMDGTILSSVKPVYEAIKRAFAKLGWEVPFGEKDIEKYFGMAGGEVYHFITPAGESWQDVRTKTREEYYAAFKEYAHLFPGVKETLDTLRERNYRLALYTNSSTEYLGMVDSVLGIKSLFDYVECAYESNLTKTELVRKIRDKFGGLEAAVVGDRIHDIEAARETGSLSIGVLFGYGEREPEQADITINSFDGLLRIFDRKLPVFEKILDEISKRKQKESAFVIGITGVDCSGKTCFAAGLEDYLKQKGYATQLINLDDFHQPRKIRYAADARDEDYYERVKQGLVFDFQRLIDELLATIRQGKYLNKTMTLLDWQTDEFNIEKRFTIGHDTLVILEGVYLFIEGPARYLDYKVFLDVPIDTWRERARARDSEDVFARYETRYLPAQMKYLEEYPPQEAADMIIDNAIWEYPVIVRYRR
jgi:uridine kinase